MKTLGAILLPASFAISALCAAEDRVYAPPEQGLWNFTLRIENTTGHEIHVRILEKGSVIGEVTVSGETLGPTCTPDGRPFANFDGTPIPDQFHLRQLPIAIHERAKELRVDETEFLKAAKTFDVSHFTARPEADFRLRIDEKQGISLTQDFLMPDTGEELSREERARERKQTPSWRFPLLNKSGRSITLRVSVDGRLTFEKHLSAELANKPDPLSRPRDALGFLPDYPAFIVDAPVAFTAKTLVVEEVESLHLRSRFNIEGWTTHPSLFMITVEANRIELTGESPFWQYSVPHMP